MVLFSLIILYFSRSPKHFTFIIMLSVSFFTPTNYFRVTAGGYGYGRRYRRDHGSRLGGSGVAARHAYK